MSLAELYETDDAWAEAARAELPPEADQFVAGDRLSNQTLLVTLTVEGDRGIPGAELVYHKKFWVDEYARKWLTLDNSPLCLCVVAFPGCCAGTEP